MKNVNKKSTGIYTMISVAVIFTLAGTLSTASAQPQIPIPSAQPQIPSASASSYGATSGGTYIYGPLNDSSTGTPSTAQVANVFQCSLSLCASSGAHRAYGSAHANAGGNAGAYSWVVAPDGSASNSYTDYTKDSVVGDSNASFSNSAVVQSALDPITNLPLYSDGTPVQVSVSLRFDGNMDLSSGNLQTASASNGGYTTSSGAFASFTLNDPNITYSGGEIDGLPQDLISFQANFYGENSSLFDYAKGRYVAEENSSTLWSLTSNHGDNLGVNTSYNCDGTVAFTCGYYNGYGESFMSNFGTGLQTVTLDTTIGATLNWDGNVDVFNQAYGATASSYSDFSNTLGVNLNPITSGVSLAFSQAQVPLSTVPLPASLWLYLSGMIGLVLVGRRKRST